MHNVAGGAALIRRDAAVVPDLDAAVHVGALVPGDAASADFVGFHGRLFNVRFNFGEYLLLDKEIAADSRRGVVPIWGRVERVERVWR